MILFDLFKAYPKINLLACKSHALKHRDDFYCANFEILGYALSCVDPSMITCSGNSMAIFINPDIPAFL
jgi:hypothetical protein